MGDMWLSNYGNDTGAFVRELERVYQQTEPLYRQLHAYVRRKLREVSTGVGWGKERRVFLQHSQHYQDYV